MCYLVSATMAPNTTIATTPAPVCDEKLLNSNNSALVVMATSDKDGRGPQAILQGSDLVWTASRGDDKKQVKGNLCHIYINPYDATLANTK